MNIPSLRFQVRLREASDLMAVGRTVGEALGITLQPSYHELFGGQPALESYVLGLWITLTERSGTESKPHVFKLVAGAANDSLWGDDETSISEYIARLLTQDGIKQWYVPTRSELLADAGLSVDDMIAEE